MKLNENNKTLVHKPEKDKKNWWLIDAQNIPLGRLATQVANILRGKDKPYYTPFMDSGDFVVVINAKEVKLTGNKKNAKMYYSINKEEIKKIKMGLYVMAIFIDVKRPMLLKLAVNKLAGKEISAWFNLG